MKTSFPSSIRNVMAVVVFGLLVGSLALAQEVQEEEKYQYENTPYERVLLRTIADRLAFVLETNQKRIALMESCFSGQRYDAECEEEREIILGNIESLYPRMRHASILHHLFKPSVILNFFRAFRRQTEGLVGMSPEQHYEPERVSVFRTPIFNRRVYRVDSAIANKLKIGLPDPDLTAEEVDGAINGQYLRWNFFEEFNKFCQAYGPKVQSICGMIRIQFDHSEMKFFVEPVYLSESEWEDMQEGLDIITHRLEFASHEEQPNVPDGYYSGVAGFYEEVFRVRQEVQDEYTTQINRYPHVLLVSTATPSDEELAHVFGRINKFASKQLDKYYEIAEKIRLGEASRGEALSLYKYQPMVIHTLSHPTDEMNRWQERAISQGDTDFDWYESVSYFLDKQYGFRSSAKLGAIVTGAIVGSIAICYTTSMGPARTAFRETLRYGIARIGHFLKNIRGVGYAFKARTRVAASPLCIPVSTALVNLGFLGWSTWDYNKAYDEIFLTSDNESYLREINELNSREFSIIIDGITLPLGVGIGSYVVRYLPRLSRVTKHVLTQKMERARELIRRATPELGPAF